MTEDKKNKTAISFEEALTELQTIVKDIETGKDGLDDMLKKYERGNELRLVCEKRLQEAKLRLEKIKDTSIESN
jgi:exodeoxyribonuclease VII small subunit